MSKEDIKTMLSQIHSRERGSAEQSFNRIFTEKVSAALENMKVDVADKTYNVNESMNEGVSDSTIEEGRFEKGEDIGEPGLNFKKIAKKAAKEYGSEESGKKVAGAILKRILRKKKAAHENIHAESVEEGVEAGDWVVHDEETGKMHSVLPTYRKALNRQEKLNAEHFNNPETKPDKYGFTPGKYSIMSKPHWNIRHGNKNEGSVK
jgi:hypothetical protein